MRKVQAPRPRGPAAVHQRAAAAMTWPLVAVMVAGCELLVGDVTPVPMTGSGGSVAASGSSGSAVTGPSGSSGGVTGTSSSSGGPSSGSSSGPLPILDVPAPTTRAARLSHLQWENSVKDLLRLETITGDASEFRADPTQSGFLFKNNALTLEVDQVLRDAYQRAAERVAADVTGDPVKLARIFPDSTATDDERARAFVESLGARAHRRPLGETEITGYLTLYTAGRSLYDGVPPLIAGIRLVIEGMLQSPYFLYRIEQSTAQATGVIPLSGHELASRLSYTLWNTMPDDELFRAAAAGELATPAGLAAQATRMLGDPRADDVIYEFHRQLFRADRFASINPSSTFFPDAPPQLGASAAREHELFLRDIFQNDGSYRDVLTSSRTFVNQDLAAVYGLPGDFGAEFRVANLDPSRRRGVLTQVGFLASNATSVNPDPIHRGVFIARVLACMNISAPPEDIPPLPALESGTNRQMVENHTEQPDTVCAACHTTFINPLGFPFENYDAIGGYRTTDNGLPVDSTATPFVGEAPVAVANAVELVDALAAEPSVHRCYVRHLLEYMHGRPSAAQDDAIIHRLGTMSVGDQASLKALVAALVSSPAFINRSVEELP